MAIKSGTIITLFVIFHILGSISALRCYSCDSSTNPLCKTSVDSEVECPATTTECYQSLSSNEEEYRRGCLDPATITCDSSNGNICERCSSDLCNLGQLPFQKCASCISDLDIDCFETSNLTNVVQCSGATAEREGCFLMLDSWTDPSDVRRGCVSELNDMDYQLCSENGFTCKICHGDSCNLKDKYQRCITCDSEDDLDCLLPQPTDDKFNRLCSDYLDSCVSYAIPGGKTARGCLNEIDPEPTFCPSTNCRVCTSSDCNTHLVPFYRVECAQCSTATDPFCHLDKSVTVAKPCPIFYFDDQCYRYYDKENGNSYRGCQKNDLEIMSECDKNPVQCSKCTSSRCNTGYILKESELDCIMCERNDPYCPYYFLLVILGTPNAQRCLGKVPFYQREQCFSYQHPDKTVERGCLLDKPDVCEDPRECTTCASFSCNTSPYVTQSCIVCNSDDYRNCDENPQDIGGLRCFDYFTYQQRGCYSYRDFSGTVHRGCRLDMPHDWELNCETEYEDRCTKCYGDDCNTGKVGAGSMIEASLLLVGGLLGLMLVKNGSM